MRTWDASFEKKLLNSGDYRRFLALFFQKDSAWNQPGPLTYQEFANRAGFASKGFINDVISGRKRLTPSSFPRVVSGLKLSNPWAEFFECLVALQEDEWLSAKHSTDHYLRRLSTLKQKLAIRRTNRIVPAASPLTDVFLERNFPEIFAGLGSEKSGSTLPMIAKRTGLAETAVLGVLKKMESVELVRADGDRYFPLAGALDSRELYSKGVFQRDFLRAVDKVKLRFPQQASASEALFMTQTFSVDRKTLPAFRQQLAKLIREFSDEAEAVEGDAIAEICIGFTNSR